MTNHNALNLASGNSTAGIYKVSIGPWIYWGQTKDFTKRNMQHLSSIKRGKHKNPILQNAYNKYQEYEFEIIAVVDDPIERSEWEQQIIDVWFGSENCANINPRADVPPSWKGKTLSDEHKAKLSVSKRGGPNPNKGKPCKLRKPMSEETKARMSASRKGKARGPMSEEQKAKISASKKGKPRSEETKAKISATILAKSRNEETTETEKAP